MTENLRENFHQVESKQSKDGRICATIRWKPEGEKYSNTFCEIIERQNMQHKSISELHTKLYG